MRKEPHNCNNATKPALEESIMLTELQRTILIKRNEIEGHEIAKATFLASTLRNGTKSRLASYCNDQVTRLNRELQELEAK